MHRNKFLFNKTKDALISQIYFVMKLYMFRTVPLSIIRSLFIVRSEMVYVIQVCRQLSNRPEWSCSKAVWHTPLLIVQWINSWWWTEELSEIFRVSCQNKFVKLVHLVGFIIKKFVTMHGHMNVKFVYTFYQNFEVGCTAATKGSFEFFFHCVWIN